MGLGRINTADPGAQRTAFTPASGGQQPTGQLPGAQQKHLGGERTVAKNAPVQGPHRSRPDRLGFLSRTERRTVWLYSALFLSPMHGAACEIMMMTW